MSRTLWLAIATPLWIIVALLFTSTVFSGCTECDLSLRYSILATFTFEDSPPNEGSDLKVSYRKSGEDTWHACGTPRAPLAEDATYTFETGCAEEVSGDLDVRVVYGEQTLEHTVHVSSGECHVSSEQVRFHLR